MADDTFRVPGFGAIVRIGHKRNDKWEPVDGYAMVVGPSACRTPGRIGVVRDGMVDLINHASNAPEGSVCWR